MKKYKQMEAMARADGWKPCPKYGNVGRPDYTTDNEIDRMVRGLNGRDVDIYDRHLWLIVDRGNSKHWAEPAQKREAYLKARGLWEEK